MDQDYVDRIRGASFPIARRGYARSEVEGFLNQLADWLEAGGADEPRSDQVRREMERLGEQTAGILTQAHDAAQAMRAQADSEIRQQLADANVKAESMRSGAEEYAQETREEADAYALKMRADVDAYAERVRIDADGYGEETRADAEGYAGRVREEAEAEARKNAEAARAEAARIVDEGKRRKSDLEAAISELEKRHDAVLVELERLASEVAGTATQHRPAGPATGGGEDETREQGTDSKPGGTAKPRTQAKRATATRAAE